MDESQTTLRDDVEAAFNETIETPQVETETQAAERARDEQGRFAPKTEEVKPVEATVPEVKPEVTEPQVQRPTTWKKEYLPLWDKLTTGQALTPDEARKLAQYTQQRETEYKTGVSTYRTEAMQAKELQEAISPFIPVLQQHNIQPAEWIKNLGTAHYTLTKGSPEQKLQMFAKLAQDYGVPLAAVGGGQGQLDPIVPQLMQQIQDLSGKVNTVATWREQLENQQIQSEISRFTDEQKYPHFETVRPMMAQLLESGLCQDLETAYAKAIRMDDTTWSAEQERLASQATQQVQKSVAVAQAKARAISPKSSTPSGTTTKTPEGLRATLEAGFDSLMTGRV